MTLSTILIDPTVKAKVVADCVQLIDQRVSAKGGFGGMALKTAYKVVNGLGAGYVPGAIERLLPEVVNRLEHLWLEGMQGGDPVSYLSQNQPRVADTILAITDSRIATTDNGLLKSSYGKLRQSIKGDVEEAVPGLAEILGTHSTVAP